MPPFGCRFELQVITFALHDNIGIECMLEEIKISELTISHRVKEHLSSLFRLRSHDLLCAHTHTPFERVHTLESGQFFFYSVSFAKQIVFIFNNFSWVNCFFFFPIHCHYELVLVKNVILIGNAFPIFFLNPNKKNAHSSH